MAKKIAGYIKLEIPAGQANPSPPVGPALGQAGVNIADMTISRRATGAPGSSKATALMVLKVDALPPEDLVARLSHTPGVLKIASVVLPQ